VAAGPSGPAGWCDDRRGPAPSGPPVQRFDATHHLTGNHVAAVHDDHAEHTCYYQAQHVRLGLPDGEKFLGAGRYDDRLRRTPDGWRFTHRRITSVWSDGNPAVITS
jgi:SnoaL-like domain